MRVRSLLGCALALALGAAAAGAEPSPQEVLYRGATLIDGTGAPPKPGFAVLVRGERIERIGPAAAVAAAPGVKVVDVSGLYLLPGLINSHEHLATPPDRRAAEAEMRRDLYSGVTAVRDMADDLRQVADLARASRVGEIPGPDLYYAALMAGPEFFLDPRTHAATRGAVAGQVPWMQAITPETDLRLAVAMAKGTGATAVKIYADLPDSLVKAITEEAHRQGMRVWAHAAVFAASPREVIDAGVDSVSHVCMLAYQVSDVMPRAYHNRAPVQAAKLQGGDNPVIEDLMRDLRQRGAVLDATDRVYVELARWRAENPKASQPYCSAELAERLTNEAYRDGVAISAGTDGFAPATDAYTALNDELELFVGKAGMSPMDAIRLATQVGALAMGDGKDMGTVEPGKLANLVFVSKDPLDDIRGLRSVVLTVKRGVDYWRKAYRPITAEEVKGLE